MTNEKSIAAVVEEGERLKPDAEGRAKELAERIWNYGESVQWGKGTDMMGVFEIEQIIKNWLWEQEQAFSSSSAAGEEVEG